MTIIKLSTIINAPITSVFDAARNIDLHMDSAINTNEKAIAGRTSGLIELHETVTWKGKHFGIYLTHQSKITVLKYPTYFVDEMIKGRFKTFKHQHVFNDNTIHTEMIDILEYETSYGVFGKILSFLALKKHITQFMTIRNKYIKSKTEYNYQNRNS
ncbi:SRPBCC family protein [Aquimarina sp. RZ0]|uniref:SRPBCC family protein n=1 Tax=Aquimarina sp. RZ0 TaxID=2607730 RepID=UPI0011F195B5|nr:SRPBCC family protein [Aquimarina sp. RZ0]KAA1245592.1 SRPBCC family protein [Aquimarina sp. RZ0]